MRVEIEATNMDTGKVATAVAIFSERELTFEIFKALMQLKPPEEMSFEEAFAEIEANSPTATEGCQRAAKAAMRYFAKQVGLAGRNPDEPVQ